MAEYFIYDGPADKLDLSQIFGPEKVLYPVGSPLVPEGELGGQPVEFNTDELEELRTNPSLNGHRFRQVSAETVKEMQAERKAVADRRERLAAKAEKARAIAEKNAPAVAKLLNGTPIDVAGATVEGLPDAGPKKAAPKSKADTEAGGDGANAPAAGNVSSTAATAATR